MIVIRMSGGMGNQMFQYALYLRLLSLGRTVKFDDVTEYLSDNARPIMLSVFGLDYPRASREEIVELTDASMRLAARVRRRLTGRRSLEYHEYDCNYDGNVLRKETAYLTGCFQSEKYFREVENEVREAYQFREMRLSAALAERTARYREEIERTESVAVHVRRGDYLNVREVYGGICTEEYYQAALCQINAVKKHTRIFLFTNDKPWGKQWIAGQERPGDFTLVEGTAEETGYVDMMLMSRCKHQVIANSSFSWWGAWLNTNPDKCVAAPARWFRDRDCSDIYTPDMIRIDERGNLIRE